jgi:hypothetical protein
LARGRSSCEIKKLDEMKSFSLVVQAPGSHSNSMAKTFTYPTPVAATTAPSLARHFLYRGAYLSAHNPGSRIRSKTKIRGSHSGERALKEKRKAPVCLQRLSPILRDPPDSLAPTPSARRQFSATRERQTPRPPHQYLSTSATKRPTWLSSRSTSSTWPGPWRPRPWVSPVVPRLP